MQIARCLSVAWIACLVAPVLADGGLKVGPASTYWTGEGSQIRLNALWVATSPSVGSRWSGLANLNPAAGGASVLGDYYFSAAPIPQLFGMSGFRASSGLLIRQSGVSLSALAWSSRSAATFGVASPLALGSSNRYLIDPRSDTYNTVPYLGIGYSGIHPKGGWGFWADVGLVIQSPGNALGLGRVISGSLSPEDLARDLQPSTLLQFGVNYSF